MLGVTYLTRLWLNQRVEVAFKNVDIGYLKYEAPRLVTTLVMGAAVGFVIGFFIPTWYRRHLEQSAQEDTRSLTLVPSAQGDRLKPSSRRERVNVINVLNSDEHRVSVKSAFGPLRAQKDD